MAPRTSYAWAFTIEAVTLVTERGLPRQQVARDLGLDIGMRRRWVTEFTTDSGRAFPAHVHARRAVSGSGARTNASAKHVTS